MRAPSSTSRAEGSTPSGGTLRVEDCVISGNIARARGREANAYSGGIFRNFPLTIVHSTIRNNKTISVSTGHQRKSLAGGAVHGAERRCTSRRRHSTAIWRGRAGRPERWLPRAAASTWRTAGRVTIENSKMKDNRSAATSNGTSADARGGGIRGKLVDGVIQEDEMDRVTLLMRSRTVTETRMAVRWCSRLRRAQAPRASRVSAATVADSHGGSGIGSADGGAMEVSDGRLILRRHDRRQEHRNRARRSDDDRIRRRSSSRPGDCSWPRRR